MDELLRFLSLLVPSTGEHNITFIPVKGGKVSSNPVGDLSKLEREIRVKEADRQYDVYFGLASYKQGWHPGGRNGKNQFRTDDNASHLRAFWMDIDCGVDKHGKAKPYPNQRAGNQALIRFLKQTGLPVPMLVNSGNGIHAYWPLSDDIPVERWKSIAVLLADIAAYFDLHVDTSKTDVPSSVLRPIGTFNRKDEDNPKLVRLVAPATLDAVQLVNPDWFDKHVRDLVRANSIPSRRMTALPGDDEVPAGMEMFAGLMNGPRTLTKFKTTTPPEERDAELMLSRCQQLQLAATSQEPHWFMMAQLMNFCWNGKEVFHRESARDKRYEYGNAQDKFETSNNGSPPTLCEGLRRVSNHPEVCDSCPHLSRRTPIVLANDEGESYRAKYGEAIDVVDVTDAPATETRQQVATAINDFFDQVAGNTPASASNAPVTLAELEKVKVPFFNHSVQRGVEYVKTEDAEDGSKIKTPIPLSGSIMYPLYFVRDQLTEVSSVRRILWQIHLKDENNNVRDVVYEISESNLTKNSMGDLMRNVGIHPQPAMEEQMIRFLRTYLATVSSRLPVIQVHKHMGWAAQTVNGAELEDRMFVAGKTCYVHKAGAQVTELSEDLRMLADSVIRRNGSLEGWKQAVAVYAQPGQEWAQFAICLSLGSVFMPWMNAENNCITHFWSPNTGDGKTAMLRAAASVWGSSSTFWTSGISTYTHIMGRAKLLRNLPNMMDEVTNWSPEVWSDIAFSLSNGRDKGRGTATGGVQVDASMGWKMNTLTTGNSSSFSMLSRNNTHRDAEFFRVLDVRVPSNPEFSQSAANNAAVDAIRDNYGWAGPEFIDHILRDPEMIPAIKKALRRWEDPMRQKYGTAYRFWIAAAGSAYIAGVLAKSFGLLNFDMKALESWIVKLMEHNGTYIVGNKRTPVEMVQAMIQAYQSQFVMARGAVGGHKVMGSAMDASMWVTRKPTKDNIIGRYEAASDMYYISAEELDKFFSGKASHVGFTADIDNMLQELVKSGHAVQKKEMRQYQRSNFKHRPYLLGEAENEPNGHVRFTCYAFRGLGVFGGDNLVDAPPPATASAGRPEDYANVLDRQ